MKILLIKSVFCPNKIYLDISLSSLMKINDFIKSIDDVHFDLLLIGWTYKYASKIILTNLNFKNIFTEFWVINYGKCKILNYSIDFIKQNDNYCHIIYLDHDIYFDTLLSENFKNIMNLELASKKIGLIAFNHKGDIRHRPSIYENSLYIDNLKIVWTTDNWAIASGAFIILTEVFKMLEYFSLDSVYGLDDHSLCVQLVNKGYINLVIANCYVIHPYDNNEKYNKWKRNNVMKMINKEHFNYYINIEESMNLFMN